MTNLPSLQILSLLPTGIELGGAVIEFEVVATNLPDHPITAGLITHHYIPPKRDIALLRVKKGGHNRIFQKVAKVYSDPNRKCKLVATNQDLSEDSIRWLKSKSSEKNNLAAVRRLQVDMLCQFLSVIKGEGERQENDLVHI